MNRLERKNRTLIWSHRTSWVARVRLALNDVLTDPVLERVKRLPPGSVLCTDLSRVNQCIHEEGLLEGENDVVAVLMDRMHECYPYVRAFHASCVGKPEKIREEGLHPFDLDRYEALAFELFDSDEVSKATTSSAVQDVVSRVRELYGSNDSRVYFAIDSRHLVKFCWHHLAYGSEYLLTVATMLDCRQEGASGQYVRLLSKRGTPTVFVCDIPTDWLDLVALRDICSVLIGETVRCSLEDGHVPKSRRLAFGVAGHVPSRCIVHHYCPRSLQKGILSSWCPVTMPEAPSCGVRSRSVGCAAGMRSADGSRSRF